MVFERSEKIDYIYSWMVPTPFRPSEAFRLARKDVGDKRQRQTWKRGGKEVMISGAKQYTYTKGGASTKTRFPGRSIPAHQITGVQDLDYDIPAGMEAGKWYDPEDLVQSWKPNPWAAADKSIGYHKYGGKILMTKKHKIEQEKLRAQQELQRIEDLKVQAEFEKQKQQMAVLAQQEQTVRQQQLVEETARQQKIVEEKRALAEQARLKREARRAKSSPSGKQFQVTKPRKRVQIKRRRFSAPRPTRADPRRASTPW